MRRHEKLFLQILRGTPDANISREGLRSLLRVLSFDERIRGVEMKQILLVLLLGCLPLTACSSKRAMLGDLDSRLDALMPSSVPGTVAELRIRDDRQDARSEGVRVPTLSMPGDRRTSPAPLTEELRAAIEAEVHRRIAGAETPFAVEVRILEGRERFRSSWASEEEGIHWRVRAQLEGECGGASAEGEVEVSARSMDASRAFLNELSRRALRNVVAEALVRAGGQLPSGCGSPATQSARL